MDKKLFWAKRLQFGDQQGETLNYNIRVLGRRGVLDLNVIASMDALPFIDQRVQTTRAMAGALSPDLMLWSRLPQEYH